MERDMNYQIDEGSAERFHDSSLLRNNLLPLRHNE